MDSLVGFVLKQQQSGAPFFDPRAGRPKCKVCGRDAWLQWDGSYADFCSRGCRDTHAVTASRRRGEVPLRPPKYSRGGVSKRSSELRWEGQFAPANRHLPEREESADAFTSKTDFLIGAAAAKRAAQALKARARRRAASPRSSGRGGDEAAQTPQRLLRTLTSASVGPGSSEGLPFQRQRTVVRFDDGDVVKEEALREYQAALSRQLTRERRRRFEDAALKKSKSAMSLAASSVPPAALKDLASLPPSKASSPHSHSSSSEPGTLQEQTQGPHAAEPARNEGRPSSPAEKDSPRFRRLEGKVAQVEALLAAQTEEQRALRGDLQDLKASIEENIKTNVKSSVAAALNASSALLQTLKQRGPETTAAAVRESQERVLAKLKAQREDLLGLWKSQQLALDSACRKLARLESAARAEAKKKTSPAAAGPSSEKPRRGRQRLQSEGREKLLQQREALYREAVAAAASREEEVGSWRAPYSGTLRVKASGVSLPVGRETFASLPHGLAFGSRLLLVVRCHCAKNLFEERRSEAFTDLRLKVEFAFRVSWRSASAASAEEAGVEIQLWREAPKDGAANFLGAARLPLPFFAAQWTYTAPLWWSPDMGGGFEDECLGFLHSSSGEAWPPGPLPHAAVALSLRFFPDDVEERGAVRATRQAERPEAASGEEAGAESHRVAVVRPRVRSSASEEKSSPPDCRKVEEVLLRLEHLKRALRRDAASREGGLGGRPPVFVDSQKLHQHLRRPAGAAGSCTNSFCGEKVRKLPDLYSEEEFRVWGLCGACQRRLFTTPIPADPPKKVILRLSTDAPPAATVAHAEEPPNAERLEAFSELRLDSPLPVAFPEPAFLWPSALQLFHAQRFADVRLQEQVRSCLDSAELVQLLKGAPALKRFERKDWHRRAPAALRTCLLLLVQQHPKLQLLLSSLRGSDIAYEDPLQDCVLEQQSGRNGNAFLLQNLAGHILMEICDGLAPPPSLQQSTAWSACEKEGDVLKLSRDG